jgi:hypothetical protein
MYPCYKSSMYIMLSQANVDPADVDFIDPNLHGGLILDMAEGNSQFDLASLFIITYP